MPPQTNVVAPPGPGIDSLQSTSPTVTVQGGSLKTWASSSPTVEHVQVVLRTGGCPLDAEIELWVGPDNAPMR